MRNAFPLMFTVLVALLISACSPKSSELIIAEYGDNVITLNEFKNAYIKSVGGLDAAKEDSISQIRDYLNLYLDYKMKLRNAEVRGYDKDEAVINEIEDYKTQIAKSFIEEKYIIGPGVKQLYEDDKYEYKFRHILLKPELRTRKEAYGLAKDLIDKIKGGENFVELAAKYSDDFATKNIGGEIYFIKPSQMPVAKFVDVLKDCPQGTVYPEPVLSAAGYHVIFVDEKRPVRYKIKVSHIIRDYNNEFGQPDTAGALAEIMEIKKELTNGALFDSLAIEYSEDPVSGPKGGELGAFSRRSMVVEFDSVAFNLKVGEVSDIIQTRFGYHIAKCTGELDYPPLEELYENLKTFYRKNHFTYRFEEYRDNLKNEFNYKLNESLMAGMAERTKGFKYDSTFLSSDIRAELDSLEIFSMAGRKIKISKIFEKNPPKPMVAAMDIDSTFLAPMINEYSRNLALGAKSEQLGVKDREFIDVVEEYKNGVMIFKLQEEEVWSKVNIDTVGLKSYYEENKEDFKWKERLSFAVIETSSDSLMMDVRSKLDNQELQSHTEIMEMAKNNPELTYREEHLVEWDNDLISKQANSIKTLGLWSRIFKMDESNYALVKLIARNEPKVKTFEEAASELVGPYQEYISKKANEEYVQGLKAVYKPVVYYELLNNLFN